MEKKILIIQVRKKITTRLLWKGRQEKNMMKRKKIWSGKRGEGGGGGNLLYDRGTVHDIRNVEEE